MDYILHSFPVSESEYMQLDKLFGDLALYASWQLIRKNAKNNHINDVEDIAQELRISFLEAGSYYKRQVYIETCFDVAKTYITHLEVLNDLLNLEKLWIDRTKHGANRQKFGETQERQLDAIMLHLPENIRPSKKQALRIDPKFVTYCKTIAWNRQKGLGSKISKGKAIYSGMVSLSEHGNLF